VSHGEREGHIQLPVQAAERLNDWTMIVRFIPGASRKEMERSNSLSMIENSCIEPISLVFSRRVERHVLLPVTSLIDRIIG
jgi:hypothetical protein